MANFNFNQTILGGRITQDVELKTTPSGISVVQFSVAVNRRGKSEEQITDFHNVVAWRQLAELVSKYFKKGSSICVVGTLQNRNWTDNNGVKRYATEVVANDIYFVDSKGETKSLKSQPQDAQTAYEQQYGGAEFEEIGNDDELPF